MSIYVKIIFLVCCVISVSGCECGLTKDCGGPRPSTTEAVTFLVVEDVECEPTFKDSCDANKTAICYGIKNVTTNDRFYSGRLNIYDISKDEFEPKDFDRKFVPAGETLYFKKNKECSTDGARVITYIDSFRVNEWEPEKLPDFGIKGIIKVANESECLDAPGESCTDEEKAKCLEYSNSSNSDLDIDGYFVHKEYSNPPAYTQQQFSKYIPADSTLKEPIVVQCSNGTDKQILLTAIRVQNGKKRDAVKSPQTISKEILAKPGVALNSCREYCDNPGGGRCVELTASTSIVIQNRLRKSIKDVNAVFYNTTKVSATTLEALLKLNQPSCSIGDLYKQDGIWTAHQKNCGFRSQLDNITNIHGDWGETIEFIHKKQEWGIGFYFLRGPQVWFLDDKTQPIESFNGAFGGEVSILEADSKAIYFGSPRACIKYQL